MPRVRPNSLMRRPDPSTAAAAAGPASPASPASSASSARSHRRPPAFALPPQLQFIATWNPSTSVYRARFDEALRNDQIDALAMWRNGLIQEQLGRRWRAGRRLRWHIEPDDPRDPVQKKSAERYTKLVEAIPRLSQLRNHLQERMWYGKAGANVVWGRKAVNGRLGWTVVDHRPVNGDSIGFAFDGTAKIQVNSIMSGRPGFPPPTVINDDRGRAILLDTPCWREQFLVGQFEPHAPDWGYESDMALALHGLGLRSRLYWTWFLLSEVQGWHLDALKRFGTNGMLYGFYEQGNDAAGELMLEALRQIVADNVAVFPKPKGSEPDDIFHQIPAANIAYEVQQQFIEKMEGVVKRAICGTEETTSGSVGASEYSKDAFDDIVMCDAEEEGEILSRELVLPMVRMNDGELPFGLKVVVQPKHQDVGEKMAAVRMLFDMGMKLDSEDMYSLAGVAPPRDGASVVQSPQAAGLPTTGSAATSGEHDADTGRSPAKNLPVGIDANLPREARSGGDDLAAGSGMAGATGPAGPPVEAARKPDVSALRAKYRAALAEARRRKVG